MSGKTQHSARTVGWGNFFAKSADGTRGVFIVAGETREESLEQKKEEEPEKGKRKGKDR